MFQNCETDLLTEKSSSHRDGDRSVGDLQDKLQESLTRSRLITVYDGDGTNESFEHVRFARKDTSISGVVGLSTGTEQNTRGVRTPE